MVIGFLKDNRLDQERKRADAALAEIAELRMRTAVAESQLQQERERADRYFAELERLRESYVSATDALVQRLREMDNRKPPESDRNL